MKPPFPAFEIRRNDSGWITIKPVKVLELWPLAGTAMIEWRSPLSRAREQVPFGDLVSTPEKAAARVTALLWPKEITPFDRHPSAAQPPQTTVAGPAKPAAANQAPA